MVQGEVVPHSPLGRVCRKRSFFHSLTGPAPHLHTKPRQAPLPVDLETV